MPESVHTAADPRSILIPRSPVRCSLCNLPVVRSAGSPPVLRHQTLAGHRGPGGAVDFFVPDGLCPQEGISIPDDMVPLIPAAPAG